MDALTDEVESLEAILMDDVQITRNESGYPELIETTVFPTVGEEVDSQYVCITLQISPFLSVLPVPGYPDVKPNIKLKNPRGLDDHIINCIEAAVRQKLDECLGSPVVFDLIDIIREHLTESNLPTGQCVICLYGFQEGDEFTKTVCYHYLHSHCLACHLKASKKNYDEELAKMPVSRRNAQTILHKMLRRIRWRQRHQFRSKARINTWIVETILAMEVGGITLAGANIPTERERQMLSRMAMLKRRIQARPTQASVKALKSTTIRIRIVTIVVDIATTGEAIITITMGTIAARPARHLRRAETRPPTAMRPQEDLNNPCGSGAR
ncbi:conserved hypothetical protein [Culex quinquefasciatus]|uniref:RWD domain-containing protein n=1 Tax=Culex quinquefasciatus TaxID=7176 RepID=B0XKD8_CULQU|nr:conserved hypothetical protein [Culex quinquefasciatus]|eukprot:XP_001870110.1 conserved hypothetical protein [Culex quinquefasciatus]